MSCGISSSSSNISLNSSSVAELIPYDPPAAEDTIKVVCRFRPLNSAEEKAGSKFVARFTDENCVSIGGGKVYAFDKVFKPNATQEKVYDDAAKSIIKDVLCGYNRTIFAYGQTSSGKTHTMEGVMGDPANEGIIPRIVNDIFNHIYSMDDNLNFRLKCSYFEIYLDKIRDLMDITKVNLSVNEDKNRVPFVKGATERIVTCPEDVFKMLEEGKANRHIAATNMNEYSSRCHSVFLIDVKQENLENQKKLCGKLYLVDLAGSENVSKSGAEGQVLDEAKNINKSLSALGNVISALAEGVKTHIPYRDSKLTRILQESLGGNARTTIIICCSPACFNESETKSTLDFGRRAKTIKNVVSVNEELTAEEWKKRYEKEKEKVSRLRKLEWAEDELERKRRRKNETFSKDEQVSLRDDSVAPTPNDTTFKVRQFLPAKPGVTSIISSDERTKFDEQERERLYQQLDEKDDEINQQCQYVETLKKQLLEQEELISTSRKENEKLQQEMSKILTQNKSTKDEIKEVLQALEELASIYAQDASEAEVKAREFDRISEELAEKQDNLNSALLELQSLRDLTTNQKKKQNKILASLLLDLNEIGQAIGAPLVENIKLEDGFEEEFTASSRLLVAKTKVEVKNLVYRCQTLETSQNDYTKKIDDYEKSLGESRLKASQTEVRMLALQETEESRRRRLEEQVDALNHECSRLRAQLEEHEVSLRDDSVALKSISQQTQTSLVELVDSSTLTDALQLEISQTTNQQTQTSQVVLVDSSTLTNAPQLEISQTANQQTQTSQVELVDSSTLTNTLQSEISQTTNQQTQTPQVVLVESSTLTNSLSRVNRQAQTDEETGYDAMVQEYKKVRIRCLTYQRKLEIAEKEHKRNLDKEKQIQRDLQSKLEGRD